MARSAAAQNSDFSDPLKEATIVALKRIVDSLVELMIDTGVTVHELSQLVRERAVRTAAKRVSKECGRDSKSRIAIATGLPRSEVARILRSDDMLPRKSLGQHPARNVLAAWFDNPRFLTANGDPDSLPIFGKRRSFEQLVIAYGRGIPVRAMLDELTKLDAVERLPDQRVRAKTRIPILTGMTSSAITVMGERTRDLLHTLTSNLRRTSKPLFVGTALGEETDRDVVSLIRREMVAQGEAFLDSANSIIDRTGVKPSRSASKTPVKCRLGITVYYFQDELDSAQDSKTAPAYKRRKNLQRQSRPTNSKRSLSSVRRSCMNTEL